MWDDLAAVLMELVSQGCPGNVLAQEHFQIPQQRLVPLIRHLSQLGNHLTGRWDAPVANMGDMVWSCWFQSQQMEGVYTMLGL